ncbi:hypothetical protein CMUST_15155 [Corynebacterium mustelae]|uniref:Uncharacterized protein n=1 Tax=Corynebacterium mustelae TaxID=571915 RepID=A0A0G3H3I9_9CORY|nr:hypothetical protein [Corynebacterium mustelae]AKK07320.1 hypothetical protein CMUST_15155 [Corynebacterium mustelae]
MKLEFKRTNNAELAHQKQRLIKELTSEYSKVEGAPMTRSDLNDLASLGLLSVAERKLYDELRRVEMLLGE